MTKSIMQPNRECWVCHTTLNLHQHHIFYGTANRKKSGAYGCWVYLCARHHNMSNQGVHFNKELDRRLKQQTQEELEKTHSREWFISTFGKSYL